MALIYLIISIALGIAGAVYEHFSFGVYSNYMIYAFAFPLIGGTLPHLLRCMKRNGSAAMQEKVPGAGATANAGTAVTEAEHTVADACRAEAFWNAAIATLTIGSILHGALQICGRPNSLVIVYPAAGLALMILTAAELMRKKKPATMASNQ